MKLVIALARRGLGAASPNPLVGAIIVKNEKIIGAGYHEKYGGPHAEVNAVESAAEDVEGAVMYVNLEPCSHHGKTPPCVDLIILRKLKKVVIGTLDVNPIVSGKGVKKLMDNGIDVKVGVLEEECTELNRVFFKYVTEKVPYIIMKIAQTLDGRINDVRENSKWITSRESRKEVHKLRSQCDGVLIGSKTVKVDNPRLTVRFTEGRNPARIVLDTKLSLKADSNFFFKLNNERIFILTRNDSKKKNRKIEQLENAGVGIIYVRKNRDGSLNLKDALKKLAEKEISSLLVEGGSKVFTSFLKSGLYDELQLFIAPKIIGKGTCSISDLGIDRIEKSLKLRITDVERFEEDIRIVLKKN